jgi:GNAT superfamily N-acetyltransferase
MNIRPINARDYVGWRPLWDGYNAFYDRKGPTAVLEETSQTTWRRFLYPAEPMFALVAETNGALVGLAHDLYHRNTTMQAMTCYLQDLFADPAMRGQGVGRALIEAVYAAAKTAGSPRVYWQTHATNTTAQLLYDRIAAKSGFIVYRKDL